MNLPETSLDYYFNLSLDALNLSNFDKAISLIDLAIDQASHQSFYMFQKIKILFVASLYTKCISYIEENLTYLYQHCSLYVFSQVLYYYELCTNLSITHLKKTLTQHNIPYVLADEYHSIYHEETIDFLKKASRAMDLHDYASSISYCELLLKEGKSSILAYQIKAKCYHLLREYDHASQIYKELISLNPSSPTAYYQLGLIMMELKEYTQSIFYFQHALKLDSSNINYLSSLAESFYQWRNYDSALSYFKKVIAQDPHFSQAYFRIGDIYTLKNKSRKAKRYYNKVIQTKTHTPCKQNKLPLSCH